MDIISALAGKLVELTVQPICGQFGYLIFYNSNKKGLKEQLEKLGAKREDVQDLVHIAECNGDAIKTRVQHWLQSVEEITVRAEEFYQQESQAKTDCSCKTCPNLWLRHQLSRRAKMMTQEVAEITGEGQFDSVSYRVPAQGIEASSFTSIFTSKIEVFESRVSTLDEIMKALSDPTINMVGLYGLGGVGKTTLANEVAKKAKEEKLFDIVIIVTVAKNPDLEKLQRRIAEMVGMKLDDENEIIRADRLYKRLKKLMEEKNLLVILDDLWERLDIQRLGIHFGEDSKSESSSTNKDNKVYKFILTSRNEDLLCSQMNCKRNIKLGVLTEEEAWELFKEMAELVDSDPQGLLSIAAQVAQCCGGLPVALVAVAKALRNIKDLNKWRNAFRRLKKPLLRNITMTREVDSSLMLSYDYLSSQELQYTFLLSAMLSQDPSIIELLMYSMGLGLLQDTNNMDEAQDELNTLVSKLKASSLLLDSLSTDCFTMHDVVRDFALSIACKEHHALVVRHEKLNEWPNKEQLEGYTTICLEKSDINEIPEELCCPRLELFLLNSKNKDLRIPNKFFEAMQKIKVMSLTNMDFPSLPSSISLLEELITLCLHSCTLEEVAEVRKLKKLKVLSFAHSTIKRLPCEVGQLSCLQMLNLANCSKLEVIPPNVLSSLKRLEVLYMENSFHQWQAEGPDRVHDNASLAELNQLPKLSTLEIHIPDASVLPEDLFIQHLLERYRIFIGDVWAWDGQYKTSKTLKLKIKDNIQFKYGVQRLLESVEDLYLDELNGIRNILYELNATGFPQLKHLCIQNNDQIESIIDSTKRVCCVDAFPNLDTLVLQKLNGLKKLCHGLISSVSFQNLRVIKVRECHQLKCLFSISMVGILSQLTEIEICDCNLINEIVVSTNDENFEQHSVTGVITFRQLRSLKLEKLPKLASFCCDENNAPVSLTHCNAVEDNQYCSSTPLFSNKVSFNTLETLTIDGINIQSILPGPTSMTTLIQNSFSNLKTLSVTNCKFISKLIPFHLLKSLRNLEELNASNCQSLEMVFDFEELNSYDETHTLLPVPLKKLTLYGLPNLKYVWRKKDSWGIVSFQSLQKISVRFCNRLESIFPVPIANDLLELEELIIYNCGTMAIVAEDEKAEGALSFVFPKLNHLRLTWLENLTNFYPGRHTLEWPQLRKLDVSNCDQLKIFQSEVPSVPESHEQVAHDTNDPLFVDGKAIPNLEELMLKGKHATMIWNDQSSGAYLFDKVKVLNLSGLLNNSETYPYGLLKRFPNLEQLEIESSLLLEIFSCNEPLGDDAGRIAPFKSLHLFFMNKLKHIWNENCLLCLILQNLESLRVWLCGGLINLGPSSVSFEKLTNLDVYRCDGLINLLNPSTARSLMNLTSMKINYCGKIEEIILSKRQDVEKVMIFKKLECLELVDLQRLKSFCCHSCTFVFPSLNKVIIRGCPALKLFCPGVLQTPSLKGIEGEENQNHWDNDLNKTIQQLFEQQLRINFLIICRYYGNTHPHVAFHTISKLEFINDEYRDGLRDIWNGSLPHQKYFSNLTSLKLVGCNWLSNCVIPSHLLTYLSKLERLEVRDCDSVEAVFDVEGINIDEGAQSLEAMNLKELELEHLLNLKYIWNKDPLGINCFQYLEEVYVLECESLTSIFPASLAKGLTKLQQLDIDSCCGVEVIVEEDKTSPEASPTFVFPQLSSLRLWKLTNLKSFYPQRHTCEWPSLKCLHVYMCKNVEVFGSQVANIADSHEKHAVKIQNPLFFVEKVIPNLEELALNQKSVSLIRSGEFQDDLFHKVKFLRLESFCDEPAVTSAYSFLRRFPKLEALTVSDSTFAEIFPCQGPICEHEIGEIVPFKRLNLADLGNLKNIWSDASWQQIIIQNLEFLEVENCFSLISLAPSSASFDHLTALVIFGCHQMTYFVTSSTAKSLVHLQALDINDCKMISEIIRNEGEDVENGIVFKQLSELKLTDLESLKTFCSHNYTLKFPELYEVVIKGCPKLEMFCPGMLATPRLKCVSEALYKERHWEGDLNKTIQQMFTEKVVFHTISKLELMNDEYHDELRDIWNGSLPHHKYFSNLTSLKVIGCNWLSNCVIPSHLLTYLSKLERLEVRDCDSVEAVFDVEGINIDEGAQSLEAMNLKELELEHLLNLKYIWNKDPPLGINCFQYLQKVHAKECESLTSIFPPSIAKGLTKLQQLDIESCGVEVIIEEGKTSPEASPAFVFPQLSSLRLWKLTNLKNFYPQRHTCEWPRLTELNVYMCKNVEAFGSEVANVAVSHEKDEFGTLYPLFLVEKVIPNSEKLTLNQKSVEMIRNGEFQDDLFHKVKLLYLESFCDETSETFPCSFLKRFPKLERLGVLDSTFEEIFPCEGSICDHSLREIAPFKELYLLDLVHLKNIWSGNSQLHPFLQNLKSMEVENCCSLINLAPSSASFDNLTNLQVSGCHQLSYFLTASTTRSLMHLEKLSIKDCKMIEEIVRNGREDVEDGIALSKLRDLELTGLESLKSFCSQNYTFEFPELCQVVIRGCPKMEMFCDGVLETPRLKCVYEELHKEKHWEGNLNKTIQQMFAQKDGPNSLEG